MLRNSKISTRLLLLIAVQSFVLAIIAVVNLVSLRANQNDMTSIGSVIVEQSELRRLSDQVRSGLVDTVNELAAGGLVWQEGVEILENERKLFSAGWQEYINGLDQAQAEYTQDLLVPSLRGVEKAFKQSIEIAETRSRAKFALFTANDFGSYIQPYFDLLRAHDSRSRRNSEQQIVEAQESGQLYVFGGLLISVIGIILSAMMGVVVYRSIARPISQLSQALERVSSGDYEARTLLEDDDELGELGKTFDRLLQERVSGLADVQQENEQLNNSIIGLLQAVFQLSQRDLTVRVPVTEDITGPVADALNLLTDETARVLVDVSNISDNVAATSTMVKSQSDKVMLLADTERVEVEKTASELTEAAQSMNHIAELAQACNAAADTAIKTTQTALETVTGTVQGINNTRDTIRETEKRIKRLGERSQEINGVVNIINTIAERTHILALNASMHAASAGEAGRGFAVVANEVQRLAENAREATSQIATLVSNIQTETNETVTTMNSAISQVVEGSRLAEQAGTQMQDTQSTTAELVAAVAQIASNSQLQAKVSSELLTRANQIKESSQQTSQELTEQNVQTTQLVEFARNLVESVGVFKLPEGGEQDSAQAA